MIKQKVAIVTPTICSEHLLDCMKSVQNQTYENIVHYIFIDGNNYFDKFNELRTKITEEKQIETVFLSDNVGKEFYGHRVYAAASFLVNADILIYLDEDNTIAINHVQKLVDKINQGFDWTYSLRSIISEKGKFICEDNCESLGKWPVYFNDQVFHIDTSSFAVKIECAIAIGHTWFSKWGADRQFFTNLKHYFPNFACSNEYSLNYRLGSNPNSVTADFFKTGNKVSIEKYGKDFPWLKPDTNSKLKFVYDTNNYGK